MEKYYSAVIDRTGQAVSEATIKVYYHNTSTLATIYSNEGTTIKNNPFLTDENGRFEFYAPDGDYDIEVSGAGISTYKIRDITIVDAKEAVSLKHSHDNKNLLDMATGVIISYDATTDEYIVKDKH